MCCGVVGVDVIVKCGRSRLGLAKMSVLQLQVCVIAVIAKLVSWVLVLRV